MILSYEGYAPHIEKPPRNKNNKFRNYAKNITNKLKIKKKKEAIQLYLILIKPMEYSKHLKGYFSH